MSANIKKVQVITFGHDLSLPTRQALMKTYPNAEIKLIQLRVHLERFEHIEEFVANEILGKIKVQGGDLSGMTQTLMVAPGSSLIAIQFVVAWKAVTGDYPIPINMIRRGSSIHLPSPEKPWLDLNAYANSLRKNRRPIETGDGRTEILQPLKQTRHEQNDQRNHPDPAGSGRPGPVDRIVDEAFRNVHDAEAGRAPAAAQP